MTEKGLACKFVSDCNLILILVNEKLTSTSHVYFEFATERRNVRKR